MSAERMLADLLRESPEWRRFFKRCCETSAERLCAQAWQFRAELQERGELVDREDLEDALLTLARKVLPETPAAQWDTEWAGRLCADALARLQERYVELSAEERDLLQPEAGGEWQDWMHRASLENDPAAFRAAVKVWEQALAETLEAAKTNPGAA